MKTFNKLLHSLGSHNPALETLSVWRFHDELEANGNDTALTNEQSQSLQCLSNGCPLLKEIQFSNYKLSTSDISYLVNHCVHIEDLNLFFCNICDDGLIITKETNKLKYLKRLDLSINSNITDECITNLIKGCHSLVDVDISRCSTLTDNSLFDIAANCPNLETIKLPFDDIKITILGLIVLFKKCPKLVEFVSNGDRIPKRIRKQLNKRNNVTAIVADESEDDNNENAEDDNNGDEEEEDDKDSDNE